MSSESSDGFVDILIETENFDEGIVVELKYSQTVSGLEKACMRILSFSESLQFGTGHAILRDRKTHRKSAEKDTVQK